MAKKPLSGYQRLMKKYKKLLGEHDTISDKHRSALVEYLYAKIEQGDWHAARDVCVDIEVLEAKNEKSDK